MKNLFQPYYLIALLVVYRDEQQLINSLIGEQGYNIKDLLQAEAAVQELESRIGYQTCQLELLIDGRPLPNTVRLVSISTLADRLARTDWPAIRRESRARERLEIDQVEAEIVLEKAEKNRIIDFVQLRYDGPHMDLLRERLAVGVGLDLPYSSGRKFKLQELEVEQLLLDQELEHDNLIDSIRIAKQIRQLNALIVQWRQLETLAADRADRLAVLRDRGVDIAYGSVDIVLFQQEALLKAQLDLRELEADIYDQYLDLLERSGALSAGNDPSHILDLILE